MSGSCRRSIVELQQKLSLGIWLTWEWVQEEKEQIRMTSLTVLTSSSGVCILVEKNHVSCYKCCLWGLDWPLKELKKKRNTSGCHVYRYLQAHWVSGSWLRSIVRFHKSCLWGLHWRVQEEKERIRLAYMSVRRSSSGAGILAKKHSRVATKAVFEEWIDLRKSPRRKGTH